MDALLDFGWIPGFRALVGRFLFFSFLPSFLPSFRYHRLCRCLGFSLALQLQAFDCHKPGMSSQFSFLHFVLQYSLPSLSFIRGAFERASEFNHLLRARGQVGPQPMK